MRTVIFYDVAGLYVQDYMSESVSHMVVAGVHIPNHNIPQGFIAPLQNMEYDLIVLAISNNRILQKMLIMLSDDNIDKPVCIIRLDTLHKKLPFMDRESFMMNRVDYLESAINGGGI